MADLTVKITETISLNGKDQGGTYSKTISGINDIYKRIVTVPSGGDTTIATFQTAVSTSDVAMDLESIKYIRVTNLDSTNSVNLSLQIAGGEDGSANMSATVLLEAGKSFMLGTVHDGIAVDDDAAGIVTALTDLESILVDSASNAVQLEVLIASA